MEYRFTTSIIELQDIKRRLVPLSRKGSFHDNPFVGCRPRFLSSQPTDRCRRPVQRTDVVAPYKGPMSSPRTTSKGEWGRNLAWPLTGNESVWLSDFGLYIPCRFFICWIIRNSETAPVFVSRSKMSTNDVTVTSGCEVKSEDKKKCCDIRDSFTSSSCLRWVFLSMMETLEYIWRLPFTFSKFSYCVIQEHKWNSLEKSKGCCPELNSLLTKENKNRIKQFAD